MVPGWRGGGGGGGGRWINLWNSVSQFQNSTTLLILVEQRNDSEV